jgi:hypothetical protein
MDILDIVRTRSTTWTYVEFPAEHTPTGLMRDPIQANQHYMTATMRSCRIDDVRVLFTKFFGTVHSYSEVQTGMGDVAQLQAVTTPNKFQDADPDNLDRSLQMDIPLLGPVPFTGGNFTIQIGLFAMKESDLSGPYLDLLQTIASKAGISFMSQAITLAQPILDGMDKVVEKSAGGLQVGLYKGWVMPETPMQGYYGIIAAPMGTFDTSKLGIDNSERIVDWQTRAEIQNPYLVFTLEKFTSRSDWKQIPEVKSAYAALISAERSADKNKINEAFTSFKVIVSSCQDLLPDDRATIVNNTQAEVNKFLSQLPQPGARVLDLHSFDPFSRKASGY